MKKIRFRKKYHQNKMKYFIYIIIILIGYNIVLSLFNNININTTNEEFIKTLLNQSNHHLISNKSLINKTLYFLSNIDFNKPTTILQNNFTNIINIEDYTKGIITDIEYNDDYSELNELQKNSGYVEDPNPIKIEDPIIYIYNTHQLESYNKSNIEVYNIAPTVMTASYIMREKLNKIGLPTMVENADFTEILRINNWNYSASYKVSRGYIISAKEKYNSLKYYIDIHRDSTNGKLSTIAIDGTKYARLMFVVGLENKNYKPNLEFARKLHLMIDKEYPDLSRGVLTKKGKGVNGVYNQDLDSNMFLIEIGGVDSNIEEVTNSISVMVDILSKYIKEN
ncbi:MAG: stage II sporulation protein P [Bacilli bacterium]